MDAVISFCLVCASCVGWQAPAATVGGSPSPATKGKILILETQRVIEGDVERIGDQYRIRRGQGEVLMPASIAIGLVASWDEAYEFMRARANLGDPDERLRLARWCHLNNLREQALREAMVAVEMRLESPEGKQLVAMLTRTAAKQESMPPLAPPKTTKPAPGIDLSAESLTIFNTRVQPILTNACGGCHSGDRGGSFQLHRPVESGGQRSAVQRTLAAVLPHINMDRPALSPLLVKAVSVHFPKGAPPLPGRQSLAFKTLEQWVMSLPEMNPHLRETSSVARPTFDPPSVTKAIDEIRPVVEVRTTPRLPADLPAPKSSTPGFVPSTLTPAANVAPATAPAAPSDPFDPIIFNRQMHPKR